ncbi:MAG: hypothetical protein PVH89_05115 [Gammaproteobacteria bacterium]|jgi:hypothetical protein
MGALLELIQNSGIATWVRESPSIFAYTTVLSLHAIGLSIIVGVSAIIALRTIGFFGQIPLQPMLKLYPVMYAGFWVNLISGLLLLSANATGLLLPSVATGAVTMTLFYSKMAFVIAAVVTLRLMRPRLAAGAAPKGLAVALLGFWTAAIIAGRVTAYPYFVRTFLGI